jgi:hypothetical protein
MGMPLSTKKYWERLLKRHRAEFARLSQFTQQPDPKFSAEITRRPADFCGQIGEPVRFRDRQPHQPDPIAVDTPPHW